MHRPTPAGQSRCVPSFEPAPTVLTDRTLAWREIAQMQAGVLSRRQALVAGMTRHAWAWRHDTGRLHKLLPAISLDHAGPPTDEQLAWAAVLHGGPGAALTGDFALLLHGMRWPQPPRTIHVATPEGRVVRTVSTGQGVRVVPVQVRQLGEHRHPIKLPPMLRLPIAALHAAARARDDRAAEWRVAAVVQQRLSTAGKLSQILKQLPRLPRRRLLAAVLTDIADGAHAGSELAFLRLLRRYDLPLPDRLQRLVRTTGRHYLDAWWQARRIGVEIDGAHHVEVGQWDADMLRANAILLAEQHDRVLLLRFTTGNLRHDAPDVAEQLRTALLA